MWRFLNLFKSQSSPAVAPYVGIPDINFDEQLKKEIRAIESYAEEVAESLQKKYTEEFKKKNRINLKVYLDRNIDGDKVEGISSDNAFEKEYRSILAVEYDGFEDDEQYEDIDISLWYYFGGYRRGTGTLYKLNQDNLKRDMEEALKGLLERF